MLSALHRDCVGKKVHYHVTIEIETNMAVAGDKKEMSLLMLTAVIYFSVISDSLYPVV